MRPLIENVAQKSNDFVYCHFRLSHNTHHLVPRQRSPLEQWVISSRSESVSAIAVNVIVDKK